MMIILIIEPTIDIVDIVFIGLYIYKYFIKKLKYSIYITQKILGCFKNFVVNENVRYYCIHLQRISFYL